jgi:hypothetical protein
MGDVWSTQRPGRSAAGEDTQYPLYSRLGRSQETGVGNLAPHRDSMPGPSSTQQVSITTELTRPTRRQRRSGESAFVSKINSGRSSRFCTNADQCPRQNIDSFCSWPALSDLNFNAQLQLLFPFSLTCLLHSPELFSLSRNRNKLVYVPNSHFIHMYPTQLLQMRRNVMRKQATIPASMSVFLENNVEAEDAREDVHYIQNLRTT